MIRRLLHGECLTVTRKTVAENLSKLPPLHKGQKVIRPLENPINSRGHIQILRGSLAPEGAVAKITGKEGLIFTGPARVFDSEEDMLSALENGRIAQEDVIVIRYARKWNACFVVSLLCEVLGRLAELCWQSKFFKRVNVLVHQSNSAL